MNINDALKQKFRKQKYLIIHVSYKHRVPMDTHAFTERTCDSFDLSSRFEPIGGIWGFPAKSNILTFFF